MMLQQQLRSASSKVDPVARTANPAFDDIVDGKKSHSRRVELET